MSKVARITLLCAIALFGAVSAWGVYSLINPQQAGHSSRTALIGGPFELTRHDGKRVSEKDFEGKYTLIFFGYTFCPDVCPAGLQVMTAALDKLGGEADQIQPVFITIDPQRDTPEVLASYIEHFHPRLIGLTGSADDIAKAAKAYRVYYAKAKGEADDDPQDYLMDHSSILYLMGPDGTFVKHFTYTTDVEKLAEAIKSALAG
jgi:protein SCO1/2